MNFLSCLIFRRNTRPPYNALRSTTLNLSEKKNHEYWFLPRTLLYGRSFSNKYNRKTKRNILDGLVWRKENNRDSCAFLPHDTQSLSDEVSLRTLVLVVIHRAHVSVVDQIYGERRHTMARTCIDKRMNGEKINKQRHALRSPFKVVKCVLNDKKKGNERFNGPCICTRTWKK